MELAGKVALVTGASSGIGRAVAEELAAAGATIVVHGRDPQRSHAVAEATGGTAVLADLCTIDAITALADAAMAVHGRIDVVVANAGVGWSGPFLSMSDGDIDALVAVDLLAPLRLIRRLVPPMAIRHDGHVCLIGSVAGRTGVAGEAVYGATKAGLDVFAESLRLELAGTGVGVSLVVPGAVRTGFFAARGREYARTFPRPVEPRRVAQSVVDAIVRDRAEVWVPGWLRLAPVVRALAPAPYRRLSARFGEPVRYRPKA